MKLALYTILLIITTLPSVFCQGLEKKATQIPTDWKELKGENYWMIYPQDWELKTSGEMGSTFALLSPLSSKKDKFQENVNLIIQDLTGRNMSLEKYVEVSEEQVRTLIVDGKILESKLITGNTKNFQKTRFTGKQGGFDLIFEQYYWVENEKAYVLSFSCEEAQYPKFQEAGRKMMDSFQLFIY